jgi:parvulin-like peptidyl-prolyl isomerase
VAIALLASACGDVVDSPAATVAGTRITAADLNDELDAIADNGAYVEALGGVQVAGGGTGTRDAEFVARILTVQIYYQLVEDELARRDITIGSAELDAVRPDAVEQAGGQEVFDDFPAEYQDALVRRLAQVSTLDAAIGEPFQGPGAAQRIYDERPELFERRCVRHILISAQGTDPVAARAQIESIRRRIEAGEDFAVVAAAESDDGSAAQGGSLDCTTRGSFVEEFDEVAWSLPVGDLSEPVETQFGFHLIQVTDEQVPALAEIGPQVDQALAQAAQEEFGAWLVGATAEADVDVNPRFGTWVPGDPSTAGDVGRVEPPAGSTSAGSDATGPGTGAGAGAGARTGPTGG